LFPGTIAGNIRFGQSEASDEAIREAARMANAHDFIVERQFVQLDEAGG
jgi:ATP-binding cassette subfamily B protein